MTSKIVNDFSITVATVNGSGSSTANNTILRALFKMGIPVSGKNLFPSNIQGQPTWYTIRVSKDGYVARRAEHDIVVAMNPASFARDLAGVRARRRLLLRRRHQAARSPAPTSRSTPCRSRSWSATIPTCPRTSATWSATWSTSASWRR